MSYLPLLLSLLAVDLLAAMSPGPNFLVVAHAAGRGNFRAGAAVVAGIVAANLVWCLAVALGLSILFDAAPWLYTALKIAGGAYLIYLGLSLWRAKAPAVAGSAATVRQLTIGQAFMRGLVTNLTNPKSLAYFGSVFALFMGPDVPMAVKTLAIGIVLLDTVLWYGTVAAVFSRAAAQRAYAALERPINRVAGAAMVLFGGRLLVVRD